MEAPLGGPRRIARSWIPVLLSAPHLRLRLFSAFSVSAAFVLVLAGYTQGRLLYGGDLVGVYSMAELLWYPTANNIVPALSVGLASGNVYAGYYLAAFLDGVIVLLCAQTMFLEVIRVTGMQRIATIGLVVVPILYVSNPVTIVDTFKSLDDALLVQNAGVLLFLAACIRLQWNPVNSRREITIGSALAVLGTAIAAEEFPLSFRIVALFGLLAILIGLGSELHRRTSCGRPFVTRTLLLLVCIGVGFAVAFVAALPLYEASLPAGLNSVNQIASSFGGAVSLNQFGQLSSTFRLLDTWGFWGMYVPYHTLYVSNPGIVLASYFWPLLGLCMPLLLGIRGRSQGLIVTLVSIGLLAMVWESGTSGPFAMLNESISSHVPILIELFPPFFLTQTLLAELYTIFGAITISSVFCWNPSLRAFSSFRQLLHSRIALLDLPVTGGGTRRPLTRASLASHPASKVIAVVLLGVLVASAYPTWAGMSEAQYFDSNVRGISIPQSYFTTREILNSEHANAILLPGLTTYIQTNWNYQGSQGFYPAFYYPSRILVPDSLGDYSLFRANSAEAYLNLTSPLCPSLNATKITGGPWQDNAWGVNFERSSPAMLDLLPTESNGFTVAWGSDSPLNFSGSMWISVILRTNNLSVVTSSMAKGTLWFGVGSSITGTIGWYVLDRTSNAKVTTLNPTTFRIDVLTNQSDPVNPESWYLPGSVNTFYLMGRFNLSTINLSIGDPQAYDENSSTIGTNWVREVIQLGFSFVMFDQTVIQGAAQSPQYVTEVESTMLHSHRFSLTYVSVGMQLFAIE